MYPAHRLLLSLIVPTVADFKPLPTAPEAPFVTPVNDRISEVNKIVTVYPRTSPQQTAHIVIVILSLIYGHELVLPLHGLSRLRTMMMYYHNHTFPRCARYAVCLTPPLLTSNVFHPWCCNIVSSTSRYQRQGQQQQRLPLLLRR